MTFYLNFPMKRKDTHRSCHFVQNQKQQQQHGALKLEKWYNSNKKYLFIAPFEIRTIPCFSDFGSLYIHKKALVIWMCQIWQKINRSLYWIPLELGGSAVASNCKFQNSGCYCAALADTASVLQLKGRHVSTFKNHQIWPKKWPKNEELLGSNCDIHPHWCCNMDVSTTLKWSMEVVSNLI